MTIESWFSSLVPLGLLLYREWVHTKRENGLMDRLMSRDFQQYKINTRAPVKRNELLNIQPRTDAELALHEMNMQEGQAAIRKEIDEKLAIATSDKNGAGAV